MPVPPTTIARSTISWCVIQRSYAALADAYEKNTSLTGVEVPPSALSGTCKVLKVIFTFTNRNTAMDEKVFVRVDVTEELPFLVTKLSPFFDR
jgi:hypothetical protein